jgi:hypothetical protein
VTSTVPAAGTGASPAAPARRGFRPASRRRSRLAAGVGLAAAAVGGNLLVYSSLDRREPVLQVVADVPAGAQISADDLRVVEVSTDSSVNAVPGDQLPLVVGKYAKVRLVAGSLVVAEALQDGALVSPGAAIVALLVPEGSLPVGLRERSRVLLVARPDSAASSAVAPVEGVVVGLPSTPATVSGQQSVSVEVPVDAAAAIAASDDVRVVLLEPVTSEGSG